MARTFNTAKPHLALALTLFIAMFHGCQPAGNQKISRSTVLVYMVADNDLNYFAWNDINEMESAFDASEGSNLIVYIDGSSHAKPPHPVMMQITSDSSTDIVSPIIYSWPERDSTQASSLKEAIELSAERFPAQSYGLILWSHGSAWLPGEYAEFVNGGKPDQKEATKTFGLDGSNRMNLMSLSEALPVHFSFIAFDACYMSSVEVLYQIKDSADYFLAAPTEILSFGFPYSQMLKHLHGNRKELKLAAREFYKYYENKKGALQSASISLVDSKQLANLAAQMRKVMPQISRISAERKKIIQQYTRAKVGCLYDLRDTVQQALGSVPEELQDALEETLVYEQHTGRFMQQLDLKEVSGLSMHIPDESDIELLNYYKKLKWYRDTAAESRRKERS